MRTTRTVIKMICLFIGVVAVIGILGIWVGSTTPHSTQGVTIVGDNEARLPAGETFILTHQVGKVRNTWEITYDGNRSVKFHCTSVFCSDLPTAEPHEGEVVEIDPGWSDNFYVSLRPDGAANVKWPYGWTYHPYEQ